MVFSLYFTQVVISGKPVHSLPKRISDLFPNHTDQNVEAAQSHPLQPYLDHVSYLYQKIDPLPEQERFELDYRDYLQSPMQPLMDNLEVERHEAFEKDSGKYAQYQGAISKALKDRVSDEKASSLKTVLMVVGAGRGPLVRASLQVCA